MDEIKIGSATIKLVNEKIQIIDNTLLLVFTSKAEVDVLLNEFAQKVPIVYDDTNYSDFTEMVLFSFKNTKEGKVYRVELAKPEISQSLAKAIEIAKVKAPDSDVVEMADLLDTFDSFVGKPIKKGTRFTYNGSVYKAINNVESVSDVLPDANQDFKKL